jgi:pimeloyl-ACP methyl ester carboxylesterase
MYVRTSLSTAEWAIPGLVRLDYTSAVDGVEDWALLYSPAQGGTDWVVMIHGHGSEGNQLFVRPDLRASWLPFLVDQGMGLLTVNLRGNAWMSPAAAADLTSLLVWLRRTQAVGRLILASGSMGGTSNLIYAALHPEWVDGVIALCPATDLADYLGWCQSQSLPILGEISAAIMQAYGGDSVSQSALYRRHSAVLNAARLRMPVVVVHATGDDIIPVTQSRALAAVMPPTAPFCYQEIAGGHHDTPLMAFHEAFRVVMSRMDGLGKTVEPRR